MVRTYIDYIHIVDDSSAILEACARAITMMHDAHGKYIILTLTCT